MLDVLLIIVWHSLFSFLDLRLKKANKVNNSISYNKKIVHIAKILTGLAISTRFPQSEINDSFASFLLGYWKRRFIVNTGRNNNLSRESFVCNSSEMGRGWFSLGHEKPVSYTRNKSIFCCWLPIRLVGLGWI